MLIAFSAGIGVLAIGIAGWMLWPAGPDADSGNAASGTETANPSVANATTSSSPQQQTATSASNAPTAGNGSQNATTVGMTPAVTVAPELSDDLKLLQGTWQVTDLKTDANQPTPPEVLNRINGMTWTFDGSFVIRRGGPGRGEDLRDDLLLAQIISAQMTKGLELTPLSNQGTMPSKPLSGIYSISEDTLTICMAGTPGSERPKELVANAVLGHGVLSLKRSQRNLSEKPQFNYAEWIKVSERLKSLDVSAEFISYATMNGGGRLFLNARSLKLNDGLIQPEIWKQLMLVDSVALYVDKSSLVTDATLQQLSEHQGLLWFSLHGPHAITSTGVKQLQNCPRLEKLHCYSKTALSADVFSSIYELKELKSLIISGQAFSGQRFMGIVSAKNLKTLALSGSQITDEDLIQIGSLTSLEALDLEDAQVTDKGLESLRNLKSVNFLGLSGTKVSDAGLQSLKSLPSLKMLNLQRTSITPQALADFQAAVPGCRVVK